MLQWLKRLECLGSKPGRKEKVRWFLWVLAEGDADPAVGTFEAA
ncbi:hypothetical protein MUK42_07718 [Musa troglodytarum]|uniref:Uncharacterized protein n=1 Tax=Musa troglodytarum TaxID=320322 RepID=A0A9E7EHB6_9LILI|nr:hypothetical protein MUK42_07718 [Musa troglodytarum]